MTHEKSPGFTWSQRSRITKQWVVQDGGGQTEMREALFGGVRVCTCHL